MKRIAVFTGTRAEYGLLYWLLRGIQEDDALELQLIVSGTHLLAEFGDTVKAIEEDGFAIDARVDMLLSSSSGVGIAKSIGVGTIGFADALDRLAPDCIVVLGDRFEALSVAQTAMVMQIPIVHLHGGELTEGAIDEAIRHSITKMAHLHFTSTETYRNRVIQLGEQPDSVFNVGAPAMENIRRLDFLDQPALEKSLAFDLGKEPLLVTYHPVTLKPGGGIESLRNLLTALEDVVLQKKIVITFPNADTHGRDLIPLLKSFSEKHAGQVLLAQSLGQIRYLSLMKLAGAVVGNSSSGLLEAPALGVPTVDIGMRQKGRIKPESVVSSADDLKAIRDALEYALSPEHRSVCAAAANPYGDGYVSEKIIPILKTRDKAELLFKTFHDLKF
ncbi:UDP-N-acetylglucosamine 2-epimerase [Marinobacter confluentis]|uniref:UDP-N-acetylglucosamine 2-epimerase (Hydrolyzing) n=1 Tax=Marinobacter confluentis TaxID=1697557 RepID=A0A4Z1BRV6_9GAMM|nr:UDP-N-acetylglucosamine 2-epimerase [Marinobacter confluentis]TGN39929.1 UDP-N-acetylglucosamine 2-epimerase (hydrolyzing) [Marinobacter confluentis]